MNATVRTFGKDPCDRVHKQLAAEVHCSGDPPGAACAGSCYDMFTPTYPVISGHTQQTENHILRDNNDKAIRTLFCWHGFQYVRVTPVGDSGFKGTLDSIVGLVINTNMTQTGKLHFGGGGHPVSERAAAVLTGINHMTLQSQRTNVAAYLPTDCPTREKHGWLGDALDASEQALYNFDMGPVHDAFLQVVEHNQQGNGDVPFVVPKTPISQKDTCSDIAWTTAYPQITEMQHTYYGDMRIIQRRWGSLVRYQENLISHATVSNNTHEGLAVCDDFKDWLCGNNMSCCAGSPSNHVHDAQNCPVGHEMGGFSYVMGLEAMSRMAKLMGRHAHSVRYARLAEDGRKDFHTLFYNTSVGRYGGDIGAIQSLTIPALQIGSPPPELAASVAQTLHDDLEYRTNYTLRVGAVTSKLLLNVLSENGLHETALRTATGTAEPSWGWWWTQNLTTCAEAFPNNFATQHGTLNHVFLCGGIGHWFWKHLVGLTPAAPAFAEVAVAPKIHDKFGPKIVSGEFLSPKGKIVSTWSITSDAVLLNVSLPVGVRRATIVVPKPTMDGRAVPVAVVKLGGTVVWDGAKLVGDPEGLTAAASTASGIAFSTTNGYFAFESRDRSV